MRNTFRNVFLGIIFLVGAVAVLLGMLGVFPSHYIPHSIIAAALIAVVVRSLKKAQFFGVFLPLGVVAWLFEPLLDISASFWQIMLCALLFAVAFTLIFRPLKEKKRAARTTEAAEKDDSHVSVDGSMTNLVTYVTSQTLESVRVTAAYSSLEIYLNTAFAAGDTVEMTFDTRLSGIKLYLPKAWKLQNDLDTGMSHLECKNTPSDAAGTVTLHLTGKARMCGIDVWYV